jgi:hypothetical protein
VLPTARDESRRDHKHAPYCVPATTNGVANAEHASGGVQPVVAGGVHSFAHTDGALVKVTHVKPSAHCAVSEHVWPWVPEPTGRQSTTSLVVVMLVTA